MAAEAYVIVSLKKYKAMMKSQELSAPSEASKTLSDGENCQEESIQKHSANSALENEDTKNKPYKAAKFQQFKTLLRHKGLEFDDRLIRQALGQAKKHTEGEEIFYPTLFDQGLGGLIQNRTKLEQYKPGWWEML